LADVALIEVSALPAIVLMMLDKNFIYDNYICKLKYNLMFKLRHFTSSCSHARMSGSELFAELLALLPVPPVGEWYKKVEIVGKRMNRSDAALGLCLLMQSTHACPLRLLQAFGQISLYENVDLIELCTAIEFRIPLYVFLKTATATTVQARLAILRQRPPENIEITAALSRVIVTLALQTLIPDFVQFFLQYGLHAAVVCEPSEYLFLGPLVERDVRNTVLQLVVPRLRAAPTPLPVSLLVSHLRNAQDSHILNDEIWDRDLQFLVAITKLTQFPVAVSWQSGVHVAHKIRDVAIAAGIVLEPVVTHATVIAAHHQLSFFIRSPVIAAIVLGDQELIERNALAAPRRSVWADMEYASNVRLNCWRGVINKAFNQPIDRIFHALSPTTRDLVHVAVKLKAQLERLELCAPLPRLPYEVWELIWQMLL